MERFKDLNNPFAIKSPEDLLPEDAHSLFVPVFNDFPQLLIPGHAFLHGPRGSGKSMMFRYLLPDCQFIANNNCDLKELPFFAIWIRVKDSNFAIAELERLDRHASEILNEHYMVMYISQVVFNTMQSVTSNSKFDLKALKAYMNDVFINCLECCGWKGNIIKDIKSTEECFKKMKDICRDIHSKTLNFIKQLSFKEIPPYKGPLCGYMDFLYPLLCGLKDMDAMPKGPIFLLFDDADKLNLIQTKILNSWVYTRTQANVSIKVSTQMQYKTYMTTNNSVIQTPHDFSETNISTVYTSSAKDRYPDRIKQIIKKRLALFDITVKPEDYFPPDKVQEKKIREIYESYQKQWPKRGRGYRPEDDAYRYAIPDYIKQLGGRKKSKSKYSYAGFKQLVDISSGIIRYFLDPAEKMYSKLRSLDSNKPIKFIPPGTQDAIIKKYSDDFMIVERERLQKDQNLSSQRLELADKLFLLIEVLGGTFSEILMSDRSERRVFSIAFYKRPNKELQEILDMGVEYGYFHESTIGNKEGTGRVRLYVLSRLLAPMYRLDPSGFSGYLFVNEEQIWEAIKHPSKIIQRIRREGADRVFGEIEQKTLFNDR